MKPTTLGGKMKLVAGILFCILLVPLNAQQNQRPFASAFQSSEAVVEKTPKDLTHASYPELGVVLSLPIISPAFGYWFGPYGIRVSGMYYEEDLNAFHLNLGYKRFDDEKKQRSINILLSRFEGSDAGANYDYTSLGATYSWNSIFGIRGLFVELGMAKVLHDNIGNVTDEFLVPCGYIGYIHRYTPK
ncbi:MAG: hypothetical protein HOG80_08420 [Candidatus Marinimicrobia bacterium]|nr:hypothetical protein [Candidatus Neomarinimicrobiota bacterium]MBT6011397.1 hypothetical protein [Candidatus Neomarinimicrobiota bacterium]